MDLQGMAPFSIGHPKVGHSARFGAAEGDRAASGKLRCSEIPHAVRAWSHPADETRFRIDPSDGGAAAGLVRFKLAVEMIGVRPLRLIFPGDSGARDAQGGEDVAIVRPHGHIGTAAAMACRAVGGCEPHGLIGIKCLALRAPSR